MKPEDVAEAACKSLLEVARSGAYPQTWQFPLVMADTRLDVCKDMLCSDGGAEGLPGSKKGIQPWSHLRESGGPKVNKDVQLWSHAETCSNICKDVEPTNFVAESMGVMLPTAPWKTEKKGGKCKFLGAISEDCEASFTKSCEDLPSLDGAEVESQDLPNLSAIQACAHSSNFYLPTSVIEYLARNSPTLQGLPRVAQSDEDLPMWACAVSDVEQLGEILIHETMRRDGFLEDLNSLEDDFQCSCSFVSHTWMGFDHPDPKGVKYNLLCQVVEAASSQNSFQLITSEGTIGERSTQKRNTRQLLQEGYLWMDFWSIPQQNFDRQSAYINNIPQFVQRCSMFIVLAPPSQHRDTGETVDIDTWHGRGWCRLELLANTLATVPSPCLSVESSRCQLMPSSWEWRSGPVGHGRFACCKLGHVHPNGKKIKCDKKRIAGMVERMIHAKVQEDSEDSEDCFDRQLVSCLRGHFLRGLTVPVATT